MKLSGFCCIAGLALATMGAVYYFKKEEIDSTVKDTAGKVKQKAANVKIPSIGDIKDAAMEGGKIVTKSAENVKDKVGEVFKSTGECITSSAQKLADSAKNIANEIKDTING